MFASPEAKGARSKTQKYAANSRNTERDGMPQCIYLRFLYAQKPLCSGVPESAAYFRRVNSEVRRKTGACRPDPGFGLLRPAVLLAKIGVCAASFDFPRTSEIRGKTRRPEANTDKCPSINSHLNAKTAFRRFPRTKPNVSSQGLITLITLREN